MLICSVCKTFYFVLNLISFYSFISKYSKYSIDEHKPLGIPVVKETQTGNLMLFG